MSLYGMLVRPNTKHVERLTEIVGVVRTGIRFRDIVPANEAGTKLVMLCRIGGSNREDYVEAHVRLKANPNFLREQDDPFDATFCCYEFAVPQQHQEEVAALAREIGTTPPLQRFREAAANPDDHDFAPRMVEAMSSGRTQTIRTEFGAVHIQFADPETMLMLDDDDDVPGHMDDDFSEDFDVFKGNRP